MSLESLEGKVAIVTGGAKGIGKAIVSRLLSDGARVVVADCDELAGESLVTELEASERLLFVKCDVSQEADVERVLSTTEARFGKIDILVNDAATQLNKPLLETSAEEFKRVMDVNVTGAFLFLKGVAKRMIAQQIAGSIVNFSSTFAIVGSPGYFAYHASKGAIDSLTRAAAIALLPYNIKVNAVAPGTTLTPGLLDGARDTGDEAAGLASFMALQPMKRFGKPEEIANVVRFLVGSESDYLRGAVVVADGAYTIV